LPVLLRVGVAQFKLEGDIGPSQMTFLCLK
jgi:hypothetical protein